MSGENKIIKKYDGNKFNKIESVFLKNYSKLFKKHERQNKI